MITFTALIVVIALLAIVVRLQHTQHRREVGGLRSQLEALPPIPSVLRGIGTGTGSAQLVVWAMRTRPGIEVLCSAMSSGPLVSILTEVVELLHCEELRQPARSAITKRPGMIRLANGSTMIFRFGSAGVKGAHPDLVWWADNRRMPAELLELINLSDGVPPVGAVVPRIDVVRKAVDELRRPAPVAAHG